MDIINQCINPPFGSIWQFGRSLKWIDKTHLEGLYCIRLLDQLPTPTEESEQWYKDAVREGYNVFGCYSAKDDKTVSCITLNLGDIYKRIPALYRCTMVPPLLITHALAHEVAHHLVATRGFVFKRGENLKHQEYQEVLANRYAFCVVKRMEERWYYRLGRWMLRDLAEYHHVWAILDWRGKRYERSAFHWYSAWCLNPDLDEAAYWYFRAKEMHSSTGARDLPKVSG